MTEFSSRHLLDRAKAVIRVEAEAVRGLERSLSVDMIPVLEAILNCSGHVLVAGSGTSWAVAERFAHLLACCGTSALFVNAANAIHGGAGAITDKDILYIISKGGKTAELNRFAEIAKSRGAKIIAQTENPASPLAALSDLVFRVSAPQDADPFGMIATGSSLVNSAACDVLCVLLLEMRGYTKEEFGRTHPGGAVGEKLRHEGLSGGDTQN